MQRISSAQISTDRKGILSKISHAFPVGLALLFPLFYIDYSRTQTVNLLLVVLGIGAAVFIVRLFTNREYLKSTFLPIFALIIIALFISDIINRGAFFLSNLRDLLYLGVVFFVIYPYDTNSPRTNAVLKLNVFSNIIVFSAFAGSAFSIFTFLFKINHTFPDVNYYIGMNGNRLWGCVNPNTGSYVAVVAIFLSAVLVYINWGRRRSIYVSVVLIGALFDAIYLVLANSRASLLGGAVGVCATAFLVAKRLVVEPSPIFKRIKFLKKREKGAAPKFIFPKALLSCLMIAALCVGFYFVSRPVLAVMPNLMIRKGSEATEKIKIETPKQIFVDLGRIDVKENISSDRFEIWDQGINLWRENTIWGVTQRNAASNISVWNNVKHMHNDYLNILVSGGIITAVLFLAAFLFYLYKIFKYYLIYRDKKRFYILNSIVTGLIFAMAVNSFFECNIFLTVNSYNIIFFFLLSFQMYSISKYEKKLRQQKKLAAQAKRA